jgi:hypothetical protein
VKEHPGQQIDQKHKSDPEEGGHESLPKGRKTEQLDPAGDDPLAGRWVNVGLLRILSELAALPAQVEVDAGVLGVVGLVEDQGFRLGEPYKSERGRK